MEPLEQDGGVQALVETMKENDRPEMASNLLELTRRVDELEAQNRALEETVRGMQKEIAALKASRFPVERTVLAAFAALQASVDGVKEQLGKDADEVKSLQLYVKPADGKVYFVADEQSGDFEL